jgi:hypothetical protein
MREIKFRAWTGEKMRRCAVSIDGKATMDFGPSNAPLMQFTGLYDRNGKEIYEGDVCKGTVYEDLEVRWGKDGWILRRRSEDLVPLGAIQQQFIEVIGNIYENPEFMKIDVHNFR